MVKRVYLHIGWEKTGTSAIQVFCARNQAWLNERGLHYPLMGELPQHVDLYWDLISGDPSRVQRSHDAVRREIDRCQQESMIFSHESLHMCSPAIFAEIFRGCDVRVIAYLRRPDAAMISFYVTMVRFGLVPADDLFRSLRAFGREHVERFAYERHLSGFASQFGRDKVSVRHYKPDELVGGQTLTDFMHLLGIDDLSDSKWPETQANLSLDVDQFAIVLRFARSLRGMPESQICELTRRLCDAMIRHGAPDGSRRVERFVAMSIRRRLLACWQGSFGALCDAYFGGRAIFGDEAWVGECDRYTGMTPERLGELVEVVRGAGVLEPVPGERFIESLRALRC